MTGRAIGHYLKTERRSVAIDFGLATHEIMLFENENVSFVEKGKLREEMTLFDSSIEVSRNANPLTA